MAINKNINRNVPSDHENTVIVKADGTLEFTSESINLSKKTDNKIRYVVPDIDEKIVKISENTDYFKNLMFVNVILTNACNLSCNYCYEQHNEDFGRFSTQSIKQIWDWLKSVNTQRKKTMNFFGGEPLVHKKIILDFIDENRAELLANNDGAMEISMTTNGLLLSENFIHHYFSVPNTKMMVSLDTTRADLDHRNIPQDKINKLLDLIEYAAKYAGDAQRFAIRVTVTREGAPYVKEFWDELYNRGVRQLVFHPLILSQSDGYIEWPTDEWEKFSQDLKDIIVNYPEVKHLQFGEGIGIKGEMNCLTGSDTIAIDPSGDFSGCYFFTNRKNTGTGKMLIGNIFHDSLYVDRYEGFHNLYKKMFQSHDACKTCNYKNTCYQCPAGNLSVGDAIFRPDAMCKRFAKLHVETRELLLQNSFKDKLMSVITARQEEGEIIYARAAVHLLLRYFNNYYSNSEEVQEKVVDIDANTIWAYFLLMIHADPDTFFTVDQVLSEAKALGRTDTAKNVYTLLRSKVEGSNDTDNIRINDEDLLYVTLLHFIVGNSSRFKDHAHPSKEMERISSFV